MNYSVAIHYYDMLICGHILYSFYMNSGTRTVTQNEAKANIFLDWPIHDIDLT